MKKNLFWVILGLIFCITLAPGCSKSKSNNANKSTDIPKPILPEGGKDLTPKDLKMPGKLN